MICLILAGVSGNFIRFVKTNKTLLYISFIPSIYILIYGIYLTLGPLDLYKDGINNFFLKNPKEKELPVVFVLLKFYQYILILVGAVFVSLYTSYLKRLGNNWC